ncbi:unnamed protein product [Prunus armeniaca]
MFKAGLISEAKHSRRQKEKEEDERRKSKYKEAAGVTSPLTKKDGSQRPRTKPPRQAEGASAPEVTVADRRWEKWVTGKRVIKGTLDVTPIPKRQRGPNEDAAVLVPDDEDEADAETVNVVCPRKVVPFMNCFIDGGQMELPELK